MKTPLPSRRALPSSIDRDPNTTPVPTESPDWRCTRCDKLLGVCRDSRMHLRFARGHEYFVGYPVIATCRGCGTMNRASVPTTR